MIIIYIVILYQKFELNKDNMNSGFQCNSKANLQQITHVEKIKIIIVDLLNKKILADFIKKYKQKYTIAVFLSPSILKVLPKKILKINSKI